MIMRTASPQLKTAANAMLGEHEDILQKIRGRKVNLAIWNRQSGPDVEDLLEYLNAPENLHAHSANEMQATGAVSAQRVGRWLALLIPVASAQRSALARDIAMLANLYAGIVGKHGIRIRLERIDSDSCKKFHADWVGIRLLCTYAGPGTQWLPNEAVDRTLLGRGSNEEICLDPGRIQSLPRYAVGLFKGEAWARNKGHGIVHRSPPISRSRKTRLLLCVDTAG